MKVYNPIRKSNLYPQLQDYLFKFRNQRNFKVEEYLFNKSYLLNQYMSKSNLSAVVVAVSGGIDSAVVLGMVLHAQKQPNSPIKRIIPVTLPVENKGAVGQSEAESRALNLCDSWKIKGYSIPLKNAFSELQESIESSLKLQGESWSMGQLVSYLRTPTLYYINSLMAEQGYNCIIAGTTNKSEGAYLGYVGKASDGMVDIQMISDIYKSEVYLVGKYLGVTEEILQVAPSGDMNDGRVDEEVFGANYDFVELYHEYLSGKKITLTNDQAKVEFNQGQEALEKLHKYNAHKYLVGSPAVHLDLIKNLVPGSWGQKVHNDLPIDFSKIVNYQKINIRMESKGSDNVIINKINPKVLHLQNILTQSEIEQIVNEINQRPWSPAGSSGYSYDNTLGSLRLSSFNEDFAKELEHRIISVIPNNERKDTLVFRKSHIASLFRFIKYTKDGVLFPHRDISYPYNQSKRTLKSVVIYLTAGSTKFLKEVEGGDWDRSSDPNEVDFEVKAEAGDVLIFEHELLHESENYGQEKIIIRTDIVYEQC